MAIAHSTDINPPREHFGVRKIGVNDLKTVLAQGWDDFLSKRGDLIFLGLFYPIVIVAAALYALDESLFPMMFPLFSGAVLLGTPAASGFYELARRRELGMDSRWRHFFDVLRSPALPSIMGLTTVVSMLFLLWMGVAWFIYSRTLGLDPPASIGAFVEALFTTSKGWTMIIVGNLAGLGFAVVTLAITVVSFPMLIDKSVDWETAVHTSIRVVSKNPVTMALWGLIIVALLILGALPALAGLAVVLPVLGYATWHLYTRAVVR